MKYILLVFSIYFLATSLRIKAEDIFHLSCTEGELKMSGPITEIHGECSKNLDDTATKNLCEMQCIRVKEGLNGPDGKPSLEKHLMYAEKSMEKSIVEKAKPVVKACFEKHAASIQSHETDKSCETSKEFNNCMKDGMMNICK